MFRADGQCPFWLDIPISLPVLEKSSIITAYINSFDL